MPANLIYFSILSKEKSYYLYYLMYLKIYIFG